MRRLLTACCLGVLCLVATPVSAQADEDDWSITRYDVAATAARDGAIDVKIDFVFDFADTAGHGPYVTIPLRQEIEGDPDHYRSFAITDIHASSSTGAPADVDTETKGGAVAIKVGDEDVEVDGAQTYQLSYRIAGVVSPGVGTAGQDEIFWNIIGQQWEVPLQDIEVRLTGPAAVAGSACFVGPAGSGDRCDSTSTNGTSATYTQQSVQPGGGLTIVADWPAGTFVGAEPMLTPRRNLGNTFTLTPLTGAAAGAVVLVGIAAVVRQARRRGRDQQFLGLIPGLTPRSSDADVTTSARDRRSPVAVQFTPPAGVRPGELGTLVDEVAHPHDVTATIVDLAVRGHLRIEETTEVVADHKPSAKDRSWRLVKLSPDPRAGEQQPLLGYEQLIYDKIFASGDEVQLDDLGTSFTGALGETQAKLYEAVTERGWFAANPVVVRRRWHAIGVGIIVLGVALAIVLALTIGWGLLGAAVVVVGVVALLLARTMPARTAEGTAVLAQTLGFQTYLRTAEADQLKFEEGVDIFSRYLPYAIAFGVAERWAQVFADLARQGLELPAPTWYVGAHQAAFFAGGSSFGESLGAFSQAATTSMSTATDGSSGGSGMSGGFSGGGVGGGGGGGW